MAAPVLPPPHRDLSTRRLSEVAKRIAIPKGIVGTDWGPVRKVCRDQLGIEFDGWQDGLGQLLLARRENGMLAHTVGGFGLSIPRQCGKAVATDAELLTANRGWTTFADVRVGDLVFHPSGRIVAVTEVHPIMFNRDCYEVTTTDGRSLVVDGEHLWTVADKRRDGRPVRTMSTLGMLDSGLTRSPQGSRRVVTDKKSYQTNEWRFALPRQFALQGISDADLEVDPYLLGAWLGNGTSTACTLWSGCEDVDHWTIALDRLGLRYVKRLTASDLSSAWALGIEQIGKGIPNPFTRLLRQLGVLNNKHIPEQYLTASTKQRLALLQGLLDTDGHATKTGTVEFCSMSKDLADGVLFLARSLGWRAVIREGKAKLDGRDYGTKYRVTFTPKLSDPYCPFRLQRKIDRIGATDGGKGRFTVSIKSIEAVATRPVRCIKVDSPDGLFLAGRDLVATHNTFWAAGALFGLCVLNPGLLAIWSAHHSDTHNETFLSMQAFAKRPQIAPYIAKVYTGSGDEEVRFVNGSRIKFGARERGFGRGVPGVDILVMDEGQILSEKAMQNMIATMNTSTLGLHIYAGTPPKPDDKSETWMRMRDEAWMIKDPSVIQVETEDTVWVELGSDDANLDIDDQAQWMKANPSYPHRTPLEAFMRMRKKLTDDGFRREALGVYDREEESVFDLRRWRALADVNAEPPEHAALVLDVSPDRRWSAIGIAGPADDEGARTVLLVHSIRGTRKSVGKIKELREELDLIDVAITPGAARALETDLTQESIEFDVMTATEVSAAYANLQEKIKDDPPSITHVDQEELNFALANSRTRFLNTGEAETFDRREYTVDISSGVAAAGALYRFGINYKGMPLIL